MCKFWHYAKTFFREEDGPTATEYAVMLALIAGVVVAVVGTIGSAAEHMFADVNGQLPS